MKALSGSAAKTASIIRSTRPGPLLISVSLTTPCAGWKILIHKFDTSQNINSRRQILASRRRSSASARPILALRSLRAPNWPCRARPPPRSPNQFGLAAVKIGNVAGGNRDPGGERRVRHFDGRCSRATLACPNAPAGIRDRDHSGWDHPKGGDRDDPNGTSALTPRSVGH